MPTNLLPSKFHLSEVFNFPSSSPACVKIPRVGVLLVSSLPINKLSVALLSECLFLLSVRYAIPLLFSFSLNSTDILTSLTFVVALLYALISFGIYLE